MRIFVTGANGFIGRALCRAALARGHEVLGLVRRADHALPEGCPTVAGTLEEIPWDKIECFRPDAALHLAWTATPGVNFHSPENEMLIGQSDALFRGLAGRGVKHLAGTGTFIEYTTSEAPLVEDVSTLLPLNPYSQAKARTMENLQAFAADAGVPWSWFRVFNAFGEGEHRAAMISATMLTLTEGQPAVIKTPDSVRDYIHVADVAHGMVVSLEQGQTGPVNVGRGSGISVFDLACEAADVVGAGRDLVRRLIPPAHDAMPVAIADISKLRATGWNPQVTIRKGLERLWNSLDHRGSG